MKPLIMNIHKEGRFLKTETEYCTVWDVPVESAEKEKQWACGLEISSLNIFCELSPYTTLYLMTRLRSPRNHPIITGSPLGVLSKQGVILSGSRLSEQEAALWIEDAYEYGGK